MKKIFLLIIALLLIFALAPTPASLNASEGSGVKYERIKINTTGDDGSAGGSATSEVLITGRIVRVDIDFDASITTTTDLTIAGANDLYATNFVNLTNTATDAQLFPTVQLTDNTGAGRTYDGTRPVVDYYPVSDNVTATITQTTAATPAVTIEIYWTEN